MTSLSRAYALGPNDSLWASNPMPGMECDMLVGGRQSDNAYALLRYKGGPALSHVHDYEDESVYVLSGTPTVTVGDVDHLLGPGSFIYMPKGIPHAIAAEGSWEGLSISCPGGIFDRLIEEVAETFAQKGSLEAQEMAEIMAKHGVRTLGEGGRWIKAGDQWVGEG